MSELFKEDDTLNLEQAELAHMWEELDDCLEFLKVRNASVTINATEDRRSLYKRDPCCWDENDGVLYEGIELRCRYCGGIVQESCDESAPPSRL